MPTPRVSVSVIIPALNEQRSIERALSCTRLPGVERIVVDGGSVDGTQDTARFLKAEKVIQALPGRAQQMDAGYREARGEVILFLHADTKLDPGWLEALLRATNDPDVSGGAFRLRFEAHGALYRLLEWGVRLRCRIGGLPYGDQGLFVRRQLLEKSDGIAPVALFEDLDLARQIRGAGRLALLSERAWTSPRRYQRNGALRQSARNMLALGGYLLGLDRDRVAAWYRRRPAR